MQITSRRLRNPSYMLYFVEHPGDPYPIKTVAEWHDSETVEITGVDKPITYEQARQGIAWAKERGARQLIYKRGGRLRTFNLTRR